MSIADTTIFIALPAMNEYDFIGKSLKSLLSQTFQNFKIILCVNQPEEYWLQNPEICKNNLATMEYIKNLNSDKITLLDKSSKGNGWIHGKSGIGFARKEIMNYIASRANYNDIIVSMDADTECDEAYLESIVKIFQKETYVALANPYYHRLTENDSANRAMLRYEIYMRNYIINMLLINSPYAFTALGSALALKVKTYKTVGGITPKKSGEDFYFLQKLRKYGKICVSNQEKVFPAARFSDRVFFGTGPAMIKGNNGDWQSYPIYHYSLFQKIEATYGCFNKLFDSTIETPMTEFIQSQFGEEDSWTALRNNSADLPHFIKACHDKIDGLRLLQYLKISQPELNKSDEICLNENFEYFNNHYQLSRPQPFANFYDLSTKELNTIRDELFNFEEHLRNKYIMV